MKNNYSLLKTIENVCEITSKSAGETNRTLCSLGIIVGLVMTILGASPYMRYYALIAMMWFFVSFGIDILQYLVQAVIYFILSHKKPYSEEHITEYEIIRNIKFKEWVNYPAWTLFFLKFVPTLIGLFLLLKGIYG